MIFAMAWLMGVRSRAKLIGFPLGYTFVVWAVFSQILNVILPLGPLTRARALLGPDPLTRTPAAAPSTIITTTGAFMPTYRRPRAHPSPVRRARLRSRGATGSGRPSRATPTARPACRRARARRRSAPCRNTGSRTATASARWTRTSIDIQVMSLNPQFFRDHLDAGPRDRLRAIGERRDRRGGRRDSRPLRSASPPCRCRIRGPPCASSSGRCSS